MSTFPMVLEHLPLRPTQEMDRPPLLGVLSYYADDPYAVRLAFVATEGSETPFTYTFARELLVDALIEDCQELIGEGQVHIGPADSEHLVLSLPAPDLAAECGGRWQLYAERERLEPIVEQMLALVPMGRDRDLVATDVDALLAELGVGA